MSSEEFEPPMDDIRRLWPLLAAPSRRSGVVGCNLCLQVPVPGKGGGGGAGGGGGGARRAGDILTGV